MDSARFSQWIPILETHVTPTARTMEIVTRSCLKNDPALAEHWYNHFTKKHNIKPTLAFFTVVFQYLHNYSLMGKSYITWLKFMEDSSLQLTPNQLNDIVISLYKEGLKAEATNLITIAKKFGVAPYEKTLTFLKNRERSHKRIFNSDNLPRKGE